MAAAGDDSRIIFFKDRVGQHGEQLWSRFAGGQFSSEYCERDCILYADGELGIKTPDGSLIWYLPFMNSPGSYLIVQDDGNVVIYRPDGGVVWATNTSQ